MSKCDRKRELKIEMNNGMVIHLPKELIKSLTIPGVVIERSYHRFVFNMETYLEELEKRLFKNRR